MRATPAHRAFFARVGVTIAIAIVALLTATPASAAPSAHAATSPTGWATASELDAFIQKERADLKLSGLSVVVLSKGSVTFDRSYGDAAPGGPAVTSKTPFVLGSTSKQFTALAIQQLIAQGKLSLDDTVGSLLQALGGEASPFAEVTVKQLLGHTSGISTNAGTADVFDPMTSVKTLTDETRHLLQGTPSTKPGTTFEYSNGNYEVLGSIIEATTGQRFEDALQTLVVEPLGLTSTTSDLARARKNGLATGHYTWFGAIDSTTPGPRWQMGAPSAYTTSTADDLTRLLKVELGGSSEIDPTVLAADHKSLAKVDKYYSYASGWYVRRFWQLHDNDANFDDPKLPVIYEHDGDTSRETSYLAFAPDLGFGVVVLSNTGLGTDNGRFGDFTARLLHAIVGTTATPRSVDPLISAAPLIMVGLPLLQAVALVALVVSGRPRRGAPARSRFRRWIPRVVAALVTVATLLVAFVVVPGQTNQSLLDHGWWSAVPDLALSSALSLLFAAACVGVGIALLVRRWPRIAGRAAAVRPFP